MAVTLGLPQQTQAQQRPYIGFVYPAGGQQGTTFEIRLGGQALDGVNQVLITGQGVSARITDNLPRLNNQHIDLLREQAKELRQAKPAEGTMMTASMQPEPTMMMAAMTEEKTRAAGMDHPLSNLLARIDKRISEYVQTPASAAIASLVLLEITIEPDAEPGERELRLVTARGISNPLVFHVGQLPEVCRKPMITATLQVLGKERLSLRKRPPEEAEDRITLPCTVNGQIASSELNRYRFEARKGQRLVISTLGRQLIPYIADAVPGWFQPVLILSDADGKEVAYDDDYQFKPDPVIFYEVPKDGDYVLAIHDSIYRGREDFVYRITIGELPFVTNIFPLGGQAGEEGVIQMSGWNIEEAELTRPTNAALGVHMLAANRKGFISNRVPFALDTLPECFEKEPNNSPSHAQKVSMPTIINGRIDRTDDWDTFQFSAKSNDTVVAEVSARRLDSPLDSVLKLTDAKGQLLAFNDDREDPGAGINTHHADSYFRAKLPADGVYYVHIGDTARKGGENYPYRLRLSAPRPDFALRVVPSSASLRGKNSAPLSIHAIRKDGFGDPIKLALKNPPKGFSAAPASISGTQTVVQLTVKTSLMTNEPIAFSIVGSAQIEGKEVTHEAVPAEDRMQAFLWRHLVPARDLRLLVFDSSNQPVPKRVPRPRPPVVVDTNAAAATVGDSTVNKPKFSKQQVEGRLRQLKLLYEENLLTDEFYDKKVAECEALR